MEINTEKLSALKGFLRPIEGETLAKLASIILSDQAIVEIGSYMGKSTCYLASGTTGAMVYAIDLWEKGNYQKRYKNPKTFLAFNTSSKNSPASIGGEMNCVPTIDNI